MEDIKELIQANQFKKFPGTRYMGSKAKIIERIWDILNDPKRSLEFDSVLDGFAGTTVVSYFMKSKGKQVFSNDFLNFSHYFAKAIIENQSQKLNDKDLDMLLDGSDAEWSFVQTKFKDLYFSDEENKFIDTVRENIEKLPNLKRSLALSALSRACLKKRPRGVFTFVGHRYDDGRKDMRLTLQEHFLENVKYFNEAVFNNGKKNKAYNKDVYKLKVKPDLVYFDPPYCTPNSDNDYIRRYHFVEGLCRYWEGIEIQEHTTTKKFKRYKSAFDTKATIFDAFERLFAKFRESIIVLSYSSNSIPNKDEMLEILSTYKSDVELVEIDHTYSFGNQNHKIGNKANRVKEYVFIGK